MNISNEGEMLWKSSPIQNRPRSALPAQRGQRLFIARPLRQQMARARPKQLRILTNGAQCYNILPNYINFGISTIHRKALVRTWYLIFTNNDENNYYDFKHSNFQKLLHYTRYAFFFLNIQCWEKQKLYRTWSKL